MSMQGIDISYWQKSNYKTLIDKYGGFVIARAAFDKTVDSVCDPIVQYTISKGKPFGVYFFPLSKKYIAENHAEWAYKQVLGYIGKGMIFLDWEAYNNHNVADVDWALRWLKKFEELSGVKPAIYMNSSCEKSYDWSSVVNNGNGLWIANYGKNDGRNHSFPTPRNWRIVMCHQYTSLGDNGKGLDRDIFFGDVNAWNKYLKPSKTEEKPKVDDTPKPVVEKPVEKAVEKSEEKKDETPVTVCPDDTNTPTWFITFFKKLIEALSGIFK